ncbi:Aste57867_14946 [Aphanomyces stellatus]|uniref:Aste57867_14946 protein n=1 Tax=Aphanomyces stellatus TaxID=120398 RepID=A0A485L1Z9_9STRA|nr:hypothetical protein As57867_014890 [Aphanomyces stellatus]VFT91760.1 Aste57867_14946 [Aphanomyces stellatus]
MHFFSPLAIFAAAASSVQAQVPIPKAPLGFTYGNGSATAPVQLEVFFDLLCPDSKAAYPGLQDLAAKLSPQQFRLRIHQFPLPYHQQAYSFAEATRTITHALGDQAFTPWLEAVYGVQAQYWNEATENLGQKQVTDRIRKLAKATFPRLTDAQWKAGMSGHGGGPRDSDTRTEWKHACTRGISGTPQYLLNDVPIEADSTWTAAQWLDFLKPLLHVDAAVVAMSAKAAPADDTTTTTESTSAWHVAAYVVGGAAAGVGAVLAAQRTRRDYDRLT